MFFTEYAKKPGIAIFLDFRKAFDTIEWPHLKTALQMFNFGPDMLNWFQIIYNQVSSCVLHNRTCVRIVSSRKRSEARLCLLFVIGIELFARALKKDPSIKGINVGQKN